MLNKIPVNANGKIDYIQLSNINNQSKGYILPRNIKEYKVMMIWQEVLSINQISIDDDFFKIGGNSILAIRMISKLQKIFATNFAINNIYKNPTIRSIVENLEDNVNNLHTDLILPIITTKKKSTPIFLVHPARGLAFSYNPLANYMQNITSVYGINHPVYSNENKTFDSIEEMASFYIDAIININDNESYCIGGWSFGGLVALEMAQQLKNRNKKVESLLLFDTSNYPKNMTALLTDEEIEKGLIRIGVNTKAKESEFFRKQAKNSNDIMQKYTPKQYYGRVILFKAMDAEFSNEFRKNDVYQGWKDIFGRNIEIYSILGNHNTIWHADYVPQLAKTIIKIIENSNAGNILKDESLHIIDAYLQHAIDHNDEFMIKRFTDLKQSEF